MLNPNFMGDWSLPGGKDVVLTIKGVAQKEGWSQDKGKKVMLPCIVFEEEAEFEWAKPLVPNSTNINMIVSVTGSKYIEDTVGKMIRIGTVHGKWFGKEQDALRVRKDKSADLAAQYDQFVKGIEESKTRAEPRESEEIEELKDAVALAEVKVQTEQTAEAIEELEQAKAALEKARNTKTTKRQKKNGTKTNVAGSGGE